MIPLATAVTDNDVVCDSIAKGHGAVATVGVDTVFTGAQPEKRGKGHVTAQNG